MRVLPNGQFTLTLPGDVINKGLRPSSNNPRNNPLLTVCEGGIGYEGVLSTHNISASALMADPLIDLADFPFPQIFAHKQYLIVCNRLEILELTSGSLVSKIVVTQSDGLWTCVDYYNFLYFSNGKVSVTRNPSNGTYSLSTTLPICKTLCDYNGQVFAGNIQV